MIAVCKSADLLLMVLDATKPWGHRDILTRELEAVGMRLNKCGGRGGSRLCLLLCAGWGERPCKAASAHSCSNTLSNSYSHNNTAAHHTHTHTHTHNPAAPGRRPTSTSSAARPAA